MQVKPGRSAWSVDVEAALARELDAWLGDKPRMRRLQRLSGGESSECHRFELDSAPPDVPARLVLRLLREDRAAEREWGLQRAAGAAGFPAPAILRTGTSRSAFERPFSIVPYVDGRDPAAAGSMRRIPALLADTMCALHRLPTAGVQAAKPDVQWDVLAVVEELRRSSRPEIARAAAWFAGDRIERERVICHGDLHPRNLLMDQGRIVAVLDWELAVLAQRSYDVARTELLLLLMPSVGTGALRPLVRLLGRRAAAQFVRAYRSDQPIDEAGLTASRALHALRIIALVLTPGLAADAVRSLWRPFLGELTARWSKLTGVAL